jgi:DNA modification methylase
VPAKNLLGIPWRVAFGLQDDGWTLRNAIIWNKPNAMPESVTDRLSSRYEHVFLFSKSRRYLFDLDAIREPHTDKAVYQRDVARRNPHSLGKGTPAKGARPDGLRELHTGGRNPGDVWTIATSPFPGAHFATMPPELAKRCILAGCPETGTVLDPFTGSGTTAMVARQLGRKFVGIELNPDYIPIIRGRIGATPFDFGDAS